MKITRLTGIMLATTAILLVPAFAMMFTEEVDWQANDFIIAAIGLFGTGAMIEMIFRKIKTTKKRILYTSIVLGMLFLVWAELAVGVFGTPFAGS
jgi:hypothetical protein